MKLTDKQLFILYSATQTVKASFEYWSDNFKEWAELMIDQKAKSSANIDPVLSEKV